MKNGKKLLALLLALTLCVGLLAGCGSSSSTAAGGSATTNADGLVIRQATLAAVSSLDPQLSSSGDTLSIVLRYSEPLYKVAPNGDLVPGLAESVDTSEDGLTWTFHIRQGVNWSNGEPVTAHDFEYSFKRLANPETGAEYSYWMEIMALTNAADVLYNGADLDTLGVEATDDYTFVLHLDRPVTYLPELLLSAYFTPINEAFCEEKGDQFGLSIDNILQCGQFRVTEWESGGNTVVCTKNPDYYAADEVTVSELDYQVVTDAQQRLMAFQSGTIDFSPISGELVETYKGTESYDFIFGPIVYFTCFNQQVEALQNTNLRMALSLAFSREEMCDNILKDGSAPAHFLVPNDFAVDSNGKSFRDKANAEYMTGSIEDAQGYWEKAKEELGVDSLEINLLYDEDSVLELVAAYLQSQWQNNLPGLTVTLSTEPKNQRVDDMKSGNYEVAITRWGADYQDATSFTDLFYTGTKYYGNSNWSSSEYDALHDKVYGEAATDPDQCIQLAIEQEKMVLDNAIICPLYQAAQSYLLNPAYNFVKCPTFSTFQYQYTTVK